MYIHAYLFTQIRSLVCFDNFEAQGVYGLMSIYNIKVFFLLQLPGRGGNLLALIKVFCTCVLCLGCVGFHRMGSTVRYVQAIPAHLQVRQNLLVGCGEWLYV